MNPKALLDSYQIHPKKSLGQNFLHDPNALEKIITVAELMPDDTVLEIGPGTGMLTARLAQAVRRVVTVEVDDRLHPVLDVQLATYRNIELIIADFLDTDVNALVKTDDYIVVANVPYYITSAILRHLLEATPRPRRIVLTVQIEVAERLVAQPGDMSLLAVSAQFYAQARIKARLNPAVFWPRPEVSSAVVRLDTYPQPPVAVPSEQAFFRVVRAGFGQKRKQLKNALGDGLGLDAAAAAALLERVGIDPRRRAETLSLEEWAALTRAHADV
ncbi:MAG: ribosomal RNA small subunit methyltransferase A [Chloroflexi bacterium]|nr:ribosomal RNA small subunit methyltransferase A [Chloroflexota bacterium]